MIAMPTAEVAMEAAKRSAFEQWHNDDRACSTTVTPATWAHRNTLDPFLHQAIFHFLRAENLKLTEFGLEALVAFDCVIQTIAGFIRTRYSLASEPSRAEICVRLGLKVELAELAEYMYFLRNNFGAHAGGWRWWDQAELLSGENLTEIALFTTQVLSAAADLETQVRTVDPSPADWGPWLFQHFEALWDSVWFDKLDQWNIVERSDR